VAIFYIHSSKLDVKSVLHNEKDQPLVAVVHALHVEESYESMKLQQPVLNNVIVLVRNLR